MFNLKTKTIARVELSKLLKLLLLANHFHLKIVNPYSIFEYQLTCSCGQNYIVQTKRNVSTRLNDNQTFDDS